MIEVLIEHGPERVNIHCPVISFFPSQNFRRHVVHCAFLRVHGLRRVVYLSCDSEVAETVISIFIQENICGFYVAVYYILLLAGCKRITELNPELDDFTAGQGISGSIFFQTCHKRHADINDITDSICILLYMIIFNRNNVGGVFQRKQELDLISDLLHSLRIVLFN